MNKARSLVGTVVSDRMTKTVVVAVAKERHHPVYKKLLQSTKKYKVHNEDDSARVGDVVKIVECRPLSREKRWRVAEVLSRARARGEGE